MIWRSRWVFVLWKDEMFFWMMMPIGGIWSIKGDDWGRDTTKHPLSLKLNNKLNGGGGGYLPIQPIIKALFFLT